MYIIYDYALFVIKYCNFNLTMSNTEIFLLVALTYKTKIFIEHAYIYFQIVILKKEELLKISSCTLIFQFK